MANNWLKNHINTNLINFFAININVEYKTGELTRKSQIFAHVETTCSEAYFYTVYKTIGIGTFND